MHQSFHPSWRLYAYDRNLELGNRRTGLVSALLKWRETISFMWRARISSDSHGIAYGYANAWSLPGGASSSPTPPNLVIFYFPQAVFSLLAAVSALFVVGYFLVTVAISIRQNRAVQ